MDNKLQRREFMKGAAAGALTITVGGVDAFLAARAAHAQAAPFRVFTADEAGTIEALGETLVPGARSAGVAHFVDHQLSLRARARRCSRHAFSTSGRRSWTSTGPPSAP